MSGSVASGSIIDAAQMSVPVVISDAPAEICYGQSVQIGTIDTTGSSPLSVVFVGDTPQGTLSDQRAGRRHLHRPWDSPAR